MTNGIRVVIVAAVVLVAGGVMALKNRDANRASAPPPHQDSAASIRSGPQSQPTTQAEAAVPRLVDLGAGKCIPCKQMAPILEELKKEYAGRMKVEFIDVWVNPKAGEEYQIRMIPTQIFYSASGEELFRHEGFFSKEDILGKWKELGVDLTGKPVSSVERAVPAIADARAKDSICFMCDGDVSPKSRVIVKGETEQVVLCSPHCFFIYHSSVKEPEKAAAITSVTDAASGNLIAATTASYLYGLDAKGRPTIAAFADRESAAKRQQESSGNILDWQGLLHKELATRCGFCDRAVYPEDACPVKVAQTTRTYGCCVMCGLGVAARLQKDIEVTANDALTGEEIRVQTFNGSASSLEPKTAVAWAGGKKSADGSWASTGCFKQAFFTNEANLKTWLDKHPTATGRMVTIGQALSAKMKMTPAQIAGACKIGECK